MAGTTIEISSASVPAGISTMSASQVVSRSRRRRIRTMILAILGIGILAVLGSSMVSAVRKAGTTPTRRTPRET